MIENPLRSIGNLLKKGLGYSLSHFPGLQHFYLMFLGVVLGCLGGLGAILFREMIELVQRVAYGESTPLGYLFFLQDVATWRLSVFPVLAAILIGPVVWYLVEETRGAGVPELLESMTLRNGRSRWQVLPAKLFVSSVSIGTIASVGREGPIVQIGSSLGSIVNRTLNIPRRHWRLISACGGAAGLAATFNTPIAGAFFMLEVVLGSFSTEHFAPIVIASVTGTVVGQSYFGSQPAFDLYQKFSYNHPVELLAYLVLGILGGLLALLFIHAIDQLRVGFEKLPIPNGMKTILGVLLLLLLGFSFFPQVIGLGYETIEHLIGARTPDAPEGFLNTSISFLLVLIVVKILATSVSLGSGFSGGVFSPSLFLGATLGYIAGIMANNVLPVEMAPPQAYAIVGMGTLFAAAAQAPVTAIIIIFEMTQDYQIILPLMIACSVSTVITRLLTDESIYTIKLIRKGVNIHEKPEELIMDRLTAEEVMRSTENEPHIHSDTPLKEITQKFLQHHKDHLFVVDEKNHVEGIIPLHRIKRTISDLDQMGELVRAVDVMDTDFPTLTRDTSLTEAMNAFWSSHYEELPVIEREDDPVLCGVLWEHDIIGVYNREIFKQKESLMKTVHQEEGGEEVTDYLELPSGYSVDQITAGSDWNGSSIRDLHLRERMDISILEIKRPTGHGEWERIPADPDVEVHSSDRLIVFGPQKEIEELKENT